MDEAALLAAARRGDQKALAQLLQQNYLRVKKYLVTVTFDPVLADDLTQETMIRAIQKIGQFGGRSQFSSWLFSIATRLYLDSLRKQQRDRRLQEQMGVMRLLGQNEEPASLELVESLQALPREVAVPVVLKHYHGYTYEEIAEFMGIPVGTVKSRIFNGVRAMRKEWRDDA